MSNVMNTPAEVVEAEFPIRIECQRLRPDSGGAGRQRGGEGLHRAYRVLADDMSVTSMVRAPRGAALRPAGRRRRRALPGSPSRMRTAGGRTCRARRTSGSARDDVVIVESCGGGGYGEPEAESQSSKGTMQ